MKLTHIPYPDACSNIDAMLKQYGCIIQKSKSFGLNVAEKYASAVTKKLGLGRDSQLCSSSNFLITNACG